jgi:peptide-methionine (R)-S-oxide reductase
MPLQILSIVILLAVSFSNCGGETTSETERILSLADSLNGNTCLVDSSLQIKSMERISNTMKFEINKTEDEWRKQLTEEEFNITRKKGTERPFTGKYYKHNENGIYICVACGNELFKSETKYDSGSGWPSFWQPVEKEKIHFEIDKSFGMTRIEVMCGKCGAHLGHVFNDGPNPTGQRYCINSASLNFKKETKER